FVSTLIFFVVRAMPGNPVDLFIQQLTLSGISPDEARNQAASMLSINLNAPIQNQYFDFLGNQLHGDLGKSYRSRGLAVSQIIAARLPWTLFSVGLSLLISFSGGVFLGTIMAYRRDSWLDHVLSNLAAALDAIGPYIIGLLAILLLGVTWKLVPIQQMRGSLSPGMTPGFTPEFFSDVLSHVMVLAAVYILSTIGGWMLTMKSSTVSTLGED